MWQKFFNYLSFDHKTFSGHKNLNFETKGLIQQMPPSRLSLAAHFPFFITSMPKLCMKSWERSMDVIKKRKIPFQRDSLGMPSVGSVRNLYKKGFSDYTHIKSVCGSKQHYSVLLPCSCTALLALHQVHAPDKTSTLLSQLVMHSFGPYFSLSFSCTALHSNRGSKHVIYIYSFCSRNYGKIFYCEESKGTFYLNEKGQMSIWKRYFPIWLNYITLATYVTKSQNWISQSSVSNLYSDLSIRPRSVAIWIDFDAFVVFDLILNATNGINDKLPLPFKKPNVPKSLKDSLSSSYI